MGFALAGCQFCKTRWSEKESPKDLPQTGWYENPRNSADCQQSNRAVAEVYKEKKNAKVQQICLVSTSVAKSEVEDLLCHNEQNFLLEYGLRQLHVRWRDST